MINYYYNSYSEFYIYLVLTLGIVLILFGVSYIVANQKLYTEKVLGYECGFDPFSDARDPFHIKFYLISILFIIFDIEVVFFFPWAIAFQEFTYVELYSMYFFIFILTLGFIYEWRKGVLDWE
jgi:NADH-quinone oxidoreductase subunit A